MNEAIASESNEQRMTFGYAIMGPILADMLWQLYARLHASPSKEVPIVFFCARGGLVLRRTLDLFARSVGLDLQVHSEDFMVSRLTAFRTAFQLDPIAVAPLIEIEFAGRTCAEAVHALANVKAGGDINWNAPFSVARFINLMESTELGRRTRAINDYQADLLRRHIDELRGTKRRVMLCDTGVFGSILRYLQVGVPAVDWHLTLLFRANYKRIAVPHFKSTVGAVSESDAYLPWRPRSAAVLYWQFIETMLEPSVPSVRYYRQDSGGRVVSDLEVSDWQDRLDTPAESMFAAACGYLRELTPGSIPSIKSRGEMAWSQLRRMIVFPTTEDVALLAVGRRCFDFGMDDGVEFTGQPPTASRSLREKLSTARASMWPEGEFRKQFPRAAVPFLLGLELSRFIKALRLERFLAKVPWRAWVSYISGKMAP
jgi:hypothetical protein